MELSSTQKLYPLSTRKFWKKIVSRSFIPVLGFGVLILLFTAGIIGFGIESTNNQFLISSGLFGVTLFLAIYVGLQVFLYGWYQNVYIQTYYYSLDENFITIKKGVFTPSEIHVQYQKIQDVYVDQDIFDRIFGIYDVHIASATVSSGIEAHIDGLSAEHAENLKNEILQKIESPNTSQLNDSEKNINEPISNFSLSEEISSKQFPIDGKWMFSLIARDLFHIVTTGLGVGFYMLLASFETDGFELWASAAYVLIGLFYLMYKVIYNIFWKRNYYFEFQNEYINMKQGVISREERNIQYESIQNVTIRQRIIDRALGICDVVIENASSGGHGIALQNTKNRTGVMGTNGLIIPGLPLSRGQKLVSLVNDIVIQKGVGNNKKGL